MEHRPWQQRPTAGPPLPDYMGVIVTSSASKSGQQVSGNTVHVVVVRTDPGYSADPAVPGTGTVVADRSADTSPMLLGGPAPAHDPGFGTPERHS